MTSRTRQTAIGLALAALIATAWLAIHLTGIFAWNWSAATVAPAAALVLVQGIGEIGEEFRRIGAIEQRRDFPQDHRAGAEAFADETPGRERIRRRVEPVAARAVEFDDVGHEQDLALDARFVALPLQALVDEALMRGMLVDDDDAVGRLRDDIGLVQLRARRAERCVFGRRDGGVRRDGAGRLGGGRARFEKALCAVRTVTHGRIGRRGRR